MTLSLIDDFIANPTDWMTVKKIVQDVHGLARKAQKFELTASAVEITAQTISNDPLQLLEKPSAPFPLTWIEWNHSLLLSWLGGQSTAPPGADHRQHGVLIHGETVYMVSRNQDETNRPTVWPMRFFLNRPTTHPTILTELHFWGNSYKDLPSDRPVKLSDLHSMEHIFHAARAQTVKVQDMSLRETMGDLRIILGILHTLNRKGAIVDGGTTGFIDSTFVSGKRIVRHAKGTVSVDLTLERPIEYAPSQPTGITRELLKRRGGFVENHAARLGTHKGCDHAWLAVESFGRSARSNERYICHACGGKKWRRRAYQRDPEATYSYRVEAFV